MFALAAVLFGANLIIDAVRGRDFDPLKVVLVVMLAVVAVGIWRRIRKDDKAE